ncbi:MAG TPA: zinc ribbon domain-containing protein, partial [Candidatus Ozemobacteraceae bacterium]|nr:zinc ribbon domain-containing protein [Candidatus Ozemobacteraceae bacterium]
MTDNPFKQNCPHCRRENPVDAMFCTVCGGTLRSETETHGSTLFFGTPAFLLLFGLGVSYDSGGSGISDWGFSLGLALITLYFFSCGALYFPARLLGKTASLVKIWEAGLFGVAQFGLAFILQVPLTEWFASEFSGLNLTQEAQLKESLLLVSFLPLLATGVFLLVRRLPSPTGVVTKPFPWWLNSSLLLGA